MTGSYITRDQCDAAFVRMHTRDQIGDRIHLLFACIAMIGIGGPVSAVDIAVLPLVVFFLVRVLNTFPVWIHGFGQPVVLATLLLAGLMGLSLLWSPDPRAGLEHISELRWLMMIGFIYPVIEHRRVLIACLCVGFIIGNGAQVVDLFDGFGSEFLNSKLWHKPGRVSGWWEPAVGGSILVAAMGLHISGALYGKGKWRWIGVVGTLLSACAIIATGTRGAWIASLALVPIIGVIVAMQRSIKLRTLLLAGVVFIASVITLFQLSPVSNRVEEAQNEIARAIDGDLDSFTGARISMGAQAAHAGASHPIKGLGAGGFRDWMETQTSSVVDDQSHAHSMGLQLFAEHGIPGVLIGVLLATIILVNAWKRGSEDPQCAYAYAPFYAMLGLLLVSAFDSVLINVNTAALLGALAALSPAYIPVLGVQKEPT